MSSGLIRLQVDGCTVQVPHGATILDAARRAGASIPTLCHREGCKPGTACMVCVVQVHGMKRLVPSCAYPVRDGMVVETRAEHVLGARRTAIELMLGEHAGDCEGPCRRACPAHMNIPLMLRQIGAGQTAQALVNVRRDIALPAVLGWVCPAPCEKNCRRGRIDQPVAICLAKRFAGESVSRAGDDWGMPPPQPGGQRVAVVGAGPAGLSCALYLQLLGHQVEILEATDEVGGALSHAVGEGRLHRSVLEADVDAILRTGVVVRRGVRLGADVSLASLRETFPAVILATGESGGEEVETWGVVRSAKGFEAEKGTFRTSIEGVFAIGSAVMPMRMAVRACADGKAAATSCDGFLRGLPATVAVRRFDSVLGKLGEDEMRECAKGSAGSSRIEATEVVPRGMREQEACGEAGRCLHCDCRKADCCRLRDLADALGARGRRFKPQVRSAYSLDRDHAEVVYEPGKCIRCGLCVRISELRGEPYGLTLIGRGTQTVVAPPIGVPWSKAIKHTAAELVDACPTGALSWKCD